MPLTNLVATAIGFRNQWTLTGAGTKVTAINDDDGLGGNFLRETTAGEIQLFAWTDLPAEATGGEIIQYQVEWTLRRAGGIAGADTRVRLRDNTTTAEISGASHIATANNPPDRFFDVILLDPNGIVWTPAQVNAVEAGVIYVAGGTGANVFFEILHITWGGSGSGFYAEGCCWLAPLLAGLGGILGANLFHESAEKLEQLDRLFGIVLRKRGIMTRPTLTLRDEAERMKWAIFRRPALCIP
jgi:hypothetical protein